MQAGSRQPQTDYRVFDRRLVQRRRQRAVGRLPEHDFLFAEMASSIAERLTVIKRDFPVVAVIGDRGGVLRATIAPWLGQRRCLHLDFALEAGSVSAVADEEAIPLAPESVDLILSCGTLHWVNDLPGTLIQMRRALRPDGALIAAMLGGGTLAALREALLAAELAVSSGAAPRVSPFADVRDLGGLLQRAGFALPVLDSDELTVSYRDLLALMRDLRGMGETNAHIGDQRPLRRDLIAEAERLYGERDGQGRLLARFDCLYLTGWAPAANQQQPLRPGSATRRLADALESEEHGGGAFVEIPVEKKDKPE